MVTFGIFLGHAGAGGLSALDHHRRLIDVCSTSDKHTTIWASDHFQEGNIPLLECWTRLTYLSALYPNLKVGTFVLGQRYRNPALVAKMAATLQSLSEGRLILGLGAGWLESEHHAYGFDFPSPRERLEQLVESIEVVRTMWSSTTASYRGKHYKVVDAFCEPKPQLPIPIMVGTNGKRALTIVAEHADMWNWDAPLDAYEAPLARLNAEVNRLGRDPSSLILTAGTEVHLPNSYSDFRGGGTRYGDPTILGPDADSVLNALLPMVACGVTHFQIYLDDVQSAANLVKHVIPALTA